MIEAAVGTPTLVMAGLVPAIHVLSYTGQYLKQAMAARSARRKRLSKS